MHHGASAVTTATTSSSVYSFVHAFTIQHCSITTCH